MAFQKVKHICKFAKKDQYYWFGSRYQFLFELNGKTKTENGDKPTLGKWRKFSKKKNPKQKQKFHHQITWGDTQVASYRKVKRIMVGIPKFLLVIIFTSFAYIRWFENKNTNTLHAYASWNMLLANNTPDKVWAQEVHGFWSRV